MLLRVDGKVMKLEIIPHRDILFRDLLLAITVKNIAWPYPVESQVKWIINNIHFDDMHVFLKDNDEIKAYMTLSFVEGILNGIKTTFVGLGCVCTAIPGVGIGKLLMSYINKYLIKENYKGLLFCKQDLIGFYEKYNWQLVPLDKIVFDKVGEGVYAMVFNCDEINELRYFDRYF